MSRIVEYRTVQKGTTEEIDEAVNGLIKEGFQPWGGVSIASDEGEDLPCIIQAMVKYEVENPG